VDHRVGADIDIVRKHVRTVVIDHGQLAAPLHFVADSLQNFFGGADIGEHDVGVFVYVTIFQTPQDQRIDLVVGAEVNVMVPIVLIHVSQSVDYCATYSVQIIVRKENVSHCHNRIILLQD
jgi:hypothetical protein